MSTNFTFSQPTHISLPLRNAMRCRMHKKNLVLLEMIYKLLMRKCFKEEMFNG